MDVLVQHLYNVLIVFWRLINFWKTGHDIGLKVFLVPTKLPSVHFNAE